jgi:hypothetical protein
MSQSSNTLSNSIFQRASFAVKQWCRWFLVDARNWARDKNPWWRLPLLLWGVYVLCRVLSNSLSFTVFDWLNLGIHELGHIIARPFPQFIHVIGGSFAQVAVPLGSCIMFLRQRDYFAVSFCFSWLAESLLHLNHYIGDAQAQALPLANPFRFEKSMLIHDWHYILNDFGLLSWSGVFAGCVWLLALFSILFFLVSGSWVLLQMPRKIKLH